MGSFTAKARPLRAVPNPLPTLPRLRGVGRGGGHASLCPPRLSVCYGRPEGQKNVCRRPVLLSWICDAYPPECGQMKTHHLLPIALAGFIGTLGGMSVAPAQPTTNPAIVKPAIVKPIVTPPTAK